MKLTVKKEVYSVEASGCTKVTDNSCGIGKKNGQ